MKIFRIDTPEVFPYVNGIIVFDPGASAFTHPITWNNFTISWNAATLTWEAAY